MTEFVHQLEIAWCAGFFDGEGCCTMRTNGTQGQYKYVRLVISQNDTQVLERFQRAVGCGKIYGPTDYKDKSLPMYQWVASRRDEVLKVIEELKPFLSPKKLQQIDDKLAVAKNAKTYNYLTDDDVKEIRESYVEGNVSMRSLGAKFSTSTGHVSDIINMRSRV